MKIIFTGASSTGKTTILNILKEKNPELRIITEVARNLHAEGVKINEQGNEEGQQMIFNKYVDLLFQNGDYISDRGLTDVYAFSTWHYAHEELSLDELAREMGEIENFKNMFKKDIVWVYFPIEFTSEDDGIRSTNEEYRAYIDDAIHQTLEDIDVDYLTVSGTVEERLNQIKTYIEKFHKKSINI